MKKALSLLLVAAFLLAVPGQAWAAVPDAAFMVGYANYFANGSGHDMDVAPFIENGRVYVPVRYLAKALGIPDAGIVWDSGSNAVGLSDGINSMGLMVGDNNIYLNGSSGRIDAAPIIRHGRVFLPARYIVEAFGGSVEWDKATQTVLLSRGSHYEPAPTSQPPVDDNTPLPRYTWQFRGEEWFWDLNITQKKANEVLEYYKKKPHPHRTAADFANIYCNDPDDDKFLAALGQELKARGEIAGLDKYETIDMGISFVQGLKYVSDSASTGYDEYPRYPLETLLSQQGDCEDTAIFIATMLREMGFGSALIILPGNPGHCAVGIKGEAPLPGYYFTVNGTRYYYLETTSPGWKVGEMPEEDREKDAIVLPLP